MEAGWNFDNTYSTLPQRLYSRLDPVPVPAPELVVLNDNLAEMLGLDVDALRSDEAVAVFAGNRVPNGATPLAQAYAGHQFGHFTMLGDGRAILLGEQITPTGNRFDIQLKGSGRTPYSRGGDGRAALGPMLREYIISEAMYGLGIPTTRSLAVVSTGTHVVRETLLPGAVLTRVAASHLRVGTFQYMSIFGPPSELRVLADYALVRHFPDVDRTDPGRFLTLLKLVIERQVDLVVQWQMVGFIHGVMNTDNMTISGETIDYGPCAFIDAYDPATVFSSIDRQGRYAYGNQPRIAAWNLARFADSLLSLIDEVEEKAIEQAQEAISEFPELYRRRWLAGMRRKLGLVSEETDDAELVEQLLRLMEIYSADYTNTFRMLTSDTAFPADSTDSTDPTDSPATVDGPVPTSDTEHFPHADWSDLGCRSEHAIRWNGAEPSVHQDKLPMFSTAQWGDWYQRWQARLGRQALSRAEVQQLMRKTNPSVIPRNHRVEEALAAAVDDGDLSVMKRLMDVLRDPFAYFPEQEAYAEPPEPSDQPYVTFCGT